MQVQKTWCIYLHRNKINNKVYIGQTCQKPEKRWNNGEGYKGSPYFYHAIKKYGWINFEHIILEKGLTLKQANEKEKYYIKYYNSTNRNFGYNDLEGGTNSLLSERQKKKLSQSHIGLKQSKETIQKRIIKNKGQKRTEEQKKHISEGKYKAVICITTNKIFPSLQAAASFYKITSIGNISSVCQGKRKHAGKDPITRQPLAWKYIEKENE